MKTKIIYISGNEVFDMADIRAAFDEVRSALGLNRDTVLFGVPVDGDDALVEQFANHTNTPHPTTDMPQIQTPEQTPHMAEMTVSAETPVQTNDTDTANEIVDTPVETAMENPQKATAKKPRGRPAKAAAAKDAEPSAQNVAPDVAPDATTTTEEKVIPILSILAARQDDVALETEDNNIIDNKKVADAPTPETTPVSADVPVTEDAPEIIAHDEDITAPQPEVIEETHAVVADIDIDAELSAPVMESEDATPQRVTIQDMITDDAPEAPIEKTLEQLLESMTPLREDHVEDHAHQDEQNLAEIFQDEEDNVHTTDEAADATLEQLATEFAENQDKIVTTPKSETHGKIGKLKNILPFKKAKRDDAGLMGDLFGWAGIAANDEEFSIPGFFTGVASKK